MGAIGWWLERGPQPQFIVLWAFKIAGFELGGVVGFYCEINGDLGLKIGI
jgi:hypothetical protein